jgi:hypothetical protein
MILNITTKYKHHGQDGMATAVLDLHFEGDNDTRARIEQAIARAMAPIQEIETKQGAMGFTVETEDAE